MAVLSSLRSSAKTLKYVVFGLALSSAVSAVPTARQAQGPNFSTSEAGNPIFDDWYADPDTEYYNNEYWIFPTYSYNYEEQLHMDAFSSPDLVNWSKHENIIVSDDFSWVTKAMWAPAAISRNGRYYLYFGANDIQEDEVGSVVGGIGVGVADSPEGPYKDAIGSPLIGDYHNGAQPIDQDVFIDDDGQAYIYYGGHSHANVAKLNEDMISLGTFDDGSTFKEITPENYTEGSQMVKRNGVYYLMWSEGGWTGPDYSVSYAMSDSPLGPFNPVAKILQQNDAVARGSGHNGVINVPGTDEWYIVYHRRPLSDDDGNHRATCYDRMIFEEDGTIRNIEMMVKDNFDDGNTIGWTMTGGEWSVDNQKLKGSGLGVALLDTNFGDAQYDTKITAGDFGAGDAPALVIRASSLDGGDYYWARLHADKVEFGITQGGSDSVIGDGAGTFEAGTEYSVRVTATGGDFKVFVDDMDNAVVTASDSTLASGKNGVSAGGSGTFDDVAVTRL